jgi:alpha-ribazole phosphatase
MSEIDKMGLKDGGPTRLYLIRHGEVEASRQKRYNGHSDVKLTERGIAQLESLSGRLAGEPIRAVYSSDLYRSRTGAEAIARRFGLEVQTRADLREKHFGSWEGLTAEEVARAYPSEWKGWLADPSDCRPAGGESYKEIYPRVIGALEEILKGHRGEEVALVAHGGVNRLILAHVLNLDLSRLFRLEQKYAALNVIDFYSNTSIVKLVNG